MLAVIFSNSFPAITKSPNLIKKTQNNNSLFFGKNKTKNKKRPNISKTKKVI